MAKLLKLRRGTNTQHNSFTGAEGEVTVNTTNDTLHVHDGSTAGGHELARADLSNVDNTTIVNGTSNVSVAASSDITFTNAGNEKARVDAQGFLFGDNDKARFGNGGDLEIYHDGSNSVIADTGTGQLQLRTNQLRVNNAANNENLIACDQDGNVQLYTDGTLRFRTTGSGIDVTGSVTCDGVTNDGSATFRGTGDPQVIVQDSNNTGAAAETGIEFRDSNGTTQGRIGVLSSGNDDLYLGTNVSSRVAIQTNTQTRLYINEDGHLMPNGTNTYDVGTAGTQFRNAYFDGTVYTDEIVCDGPALIAAGTGELRLRDNDDSGANNYSTSVLRGQDSAGTNKWWIGDTSSGNPYLEVWNAQNGPVVFGTNNTNRVYIHGSDGHLLPWTNNTYDLGSSSNRWRNVYTNDLNLSNEGGTNDVDGTWGSWTIQEGEDDLFLLNRRNGKKYKFNLSEVN